jgi:hypothetical protein
VCVLELVSDLTLHDSEKDLRESDCTDYDWVGEVMFVINSSEHTRSFTERHRRGTGWRGKEHGQGRAGRSWTLGGT